MSDLENKLVERLHSMAAYNDKDFFWTNHSAEVSEKLRSQWREEIVGLVAEIGESRFSPELLGDLASSEIVRDGSGDLARKVKSWLSNHRNS